MRAVSFVLIAASIACAAKAQNPLDALRDLVLARANNVEVREIRLRADPEPRVRPLEGIVVQALLFDENEAGEAVRVQKEGVTFRVEKAEHGQLSKPFRYQGDEEERLKASASGVMGVILQQGTARFAFQDSTLYSAPEKPGRYTVFASVGWAEASIEIEVTPEAPSHAPVETVDFPPEPRDRSPYRAIAEHYAPFIAQETWFEPKSDFLSRVDLDGDWDGSNNWENAMWGSSQAYVYYAAMETATHIFLHYNFFHPRDYSDKCVVGTCHENDNEGIVLTIRKDGSRWGKLRTMETLAHNNIYSFVLDRDVRNGVHDIDGRIELHDGSHPGVFLEAAGHGALGTSSSHSYFDFSKREFKSGTGLTYVYKGRAERPPHANAREVGYELLPIWEHWWLRAHTDPEQQLFDDFYLYQPVGVRPVPPYRLIAGAFRGVTKSENKAKPFWGWHDSKTLKARVLATGQWALDPAYSTPINLRFPEKFSQEYTHNPYLGIGTPPGDTMAVGLVSAPPASDGIAAPRPGAPEIAAPQPETPVTTSGVLNYDATVTGEAILEIRGAQVAPVTGSPERAKATFSAPIPPVALASLDATARNGNVDILARPTADNRWATILRVRPDGRSGRVRFVLEWKR